MAAVGRGKNPEDPDAKRGTQRVERGEMRFANPVLRQIIEG